MSGLATIPPEVLSRAGVAYVHYVSFMLCFGALVLERRLIKANPSKADATLMVITDVVYGLAALALLVSGILRVLYFGQGSDAIGHIGDHHQGGVLLAGVGLDQAPLQHQGTEAEHEAHVVHVGHPGAREQVGGDGGQASHGQVAVVATVMGEPVRVRLCCLNTVRRFAPRDLRQDICLN